MARQRINPDPAPERIIRPVASPVDTYVRPDVRSFMSVAEAFGDMVPGLQQLGNSIIDSIAKRETVEGAIEGRNEAFKPASESKQSRIAQQIERAGGVSPWRAQAHLQSLGATAAQQGYGAELDKNFEEWTNPQNADGSPRDPSYISGKMKETWDSFSKGLPNSYYARASAEEVRAQMDSQFINQANAKVAEKIKKQHVEQITNEIVGILNTWDSADDALASGGAFDKATKRFYEATGQSPDEVSLKALSEWAKIEASNDSGADPSTVRAILANALESGIGGRQFGEAAKLELTKIIDDVDDIIEKNAMQSTQTRQRLRADVQGLIQTRLRTQFLETGRVPTKGEWVAIAREAVTEAGGADSIRFLEGDALADIESTITALTKPPAFSDAEEEVLWNSVKGLPPAEAASTLSSMVANGMLPMDARERLMARRSQQDTVPEDTRSRIESAKATTLSGTAWAGLPMEAISKDGQARLLAIGQTEAVVAYDAAFTQWAASPEGQSVMALQDPNAKRAQIFAKSLEIQAQVQKSLQEKHRDLIAEYDRTNSYSEVVEPMLKEEMPIILNTIGVGPAEGEDPAVGSANNQEAALRRLVNSIGMEWHDQFPGSMTQLSKAFKTEGVDYILRRLDEIRANPDELQKRVGRNNVPLLYKPQVELAQEATTGETAPAVSMPTSQVYNMNWFGDRGRFSSKLSRVVELSDKIKQGTATEADRASLETAKDNVQQEANWTLTYGLNDNRNYRINGSVVERKRTSVRPGNRASQNMEWVADPQATNLLRASYMIKGINLYEITGSEINAPMTTFEGYKIRKEDLNPEVQPLFTSVDQFEQYRKDGRLRQVYEAVRDLGYNKLDPITFERTQAALVYSRFPKKTKAPTNQ